MSDIGARLAERSSLLAGATDPISPSPVTIRLHSYADVRAASSSGSRKPLLMTLAVVVYGLCMLVWWLGGSAALGMERFTPNVGSTGSIFGNWSSVVDPRVLNPELVDPDSIRVPKLKCLGWRQTKNCDPNGERDEEMDLPCDQAITGGVTSGYCAMLDEETGEEVRAMVSNCSSVRYGIKYRCSQAKEMAKIPAQMSQLVAKARWIDAVEKQNHTLLRREEEPQTPVNGIVMVVYPKLLVSVYATIRILREVHNCTLPIELWYLKSEMGHTIDDPTVTRPILRTLVNEYGPISLHKIKDMRARGYNAKVYAVAHSEFDQVLFLDADNMPVRDPTYLFTDSKVFNETGAVFWPDFWLPGHTIFNIHKSSMLWEVVGTPFVDMFEQESGQILVDRRRAKSSGALAALEYLALHFPNPISTMRLAHGDKDLFRLAWMKAGAPFHMVRHPPAAAGSKLDIDKKGTVFCGMTMVQFDPDASVNAGVDTILFMHRNAKKLLGFENDAKDIAWTHVQVFQYPEEAMATPETQWAHTREHYRIQIGGLLEAASVIGSARCYGDRDLKSPHFALTAVEDVAPWHIRELETTLLQFGRDAVKLNSIPAPTNVEDRLGDGLLQPVLPLGTSEVGPVAVGSGQAVASRAPN